MVAECQNRRLGSNVFQYEFPEDARNQTLGTSRNKQSVSISLYGDDDGDENGDGVDDDDDDDANDSNDDGDADE